MLEDLKAEMDQYHDMLSRLRKIGQDEIDRLEEAGELTWTQAQFESVELDRMMRARWLR